ncbi:MAG: hypothetical protein AMJ46_14480, partial [Latescibacteria bacterium DG_63]
GQIGASLVTYIAEDNDWSSYDFPEATYSNNVLYIAFTSSACSGCGNAPPVTSVSGAGLNFTEIGTPGGLTYSSNNRRIQAWRALVTSGATTGVVTVTLNDPNGWSMGFGAAMIEVTGTKTSGTNGADAVVNYATNGGSGTSLEVTMAAFADPNNRPVAFFSHRDEEPTNPETGYTELWSGTTNSPLMGYLAEWHDTLTGETTPPTPSAWWASSGGCGGFALEIAAATEPTTRTVAIYPSGATPPSGYDATYTSMSAMEAAEDGDLVALNRFLRVEIVNSDGNWSTADTTAVTFDGWNCNRADGRYVEIEVMSGARNPYTDGKWSTSHYRLSASGATLLIDNDAAVDNYFEADFIGLQVEASGSNWAAAVRDVAYHKTIRFIACHFRNTGFEVFQLTDNNSAQVWFINSILESTNPVDEIVRATSAWTATAYFYNCTVVGGGLDGLDVDQGTITVKNCAVFNNGPTDILVLGGATVDYNASDDSVGTNWVDISPGAEPDGWNAAVTDYANGDYRLKDTNSVLYHAGLDQNSDSNVPSEDIAGNARPTGSNPVSIGAFEYVGVTTTLGDGTDPGNSTVAPGSADQYLDQFTFVTSSGSDSVTALTVTTANTAAIASVEIWNDAGDTRYFSTVSSPSGDTWSFSGGTSIPVTTSSASFRVRFTAKGHAALAAGTYAVTGTVTSYTCTNAQAGTDTDSATITVDNSPPADATWGTITPGNTQIQLNWTNPGDADFNKVVILRRVSSAVGDVPTDGTEYNVNDTIGSSTVRYVGSLQTFTDTGLTNGTDYYYKIFAYDTYINYASGAGTGPHTPTASSTVEVWVSANSDDSEETISSGYIDWGSSDLELGYQSSGSPPSAQIVGMRFTNIIIPQGATITNAYIQFTVDEVSTDTPANLTFSGELTANAPTFEDVPDNLSDRLVNNTTASVAWNNVPAWNTAPEAGPNQQTPNLSPIIQEIVNQGTWASGNALVIFVEGEGRRCAESHEGANGHGDPTRAPYIHIEYSVIVPTTTLGDGTDPGNSTVAPGSAGQYLDQFTFVTNTGTDSVTALTVTTANTAAIASAEIWNDAGDTQYFSTVSSPSGDTWSFSGGTAIPVSTSSASFRVRFTAKSHAALAAGTYAVTGTVTSYTCTNAQTGTDTDSATITVDNSPPADATWGTITPGDTQIELNWTNPGDADFNKVVILRRAGAAVGDAPTDGTEYNVNDTIGSSTVRYVGSLQTFTDTGLTTGTDYYYRIFAYDTYINYASGTSTGPHTPPDCGYAYKRAITIDHNQVIGDIGDTVDLIDFPVLIKESGTWLRNSAYTDGRIESADGYDLIFKDSTETLTLAHEIEYYYAGSEAENGELVAWVKIPTLDADANTVIYMYYGNSCITSETQNKNAVWNSSYKLVQHLQETSGTHEDSTGNNNHSTSVTVTTQGSATGKIDGADDFELDSSNNIAIGDSSSLDITDAITVEAWINPETYDDGNSHRIVTKGGEKYVLRSYCTTTDPK